MCTGYFNIENMHSQYIVRAVRLITILGSYSFYCFSRGHGLCLLRGTDCAFEYN
jgi:hypothetical protein